MNDCIFCKIAAGEIPATTVYEDDDFMAFLDINPVRKGHVLIISKEHHIWMQDTPDHLVSGAFVLAKHLMNGMKKGLGAAYVQVGVVGTEIPHFHIHLIPHSLSEEIPPSFRHHEAYVDDSEKDSYATMIKSAL